MGQVHLGGEHDIHNTDVPGQRGTVSANQALWEGRLCRWCGGRWHEVLPGRWRIWFWPGSLVKTRPAQP